MSVFVSYFRTKSKRSSKPMRKKTLSMDNLDALLQSETESFSSCSSESFGSTSVLKVKTHEQSLSESFYDSNKTGLALNDRNVRFSNLHIHCHPIMLGDNPCVEPDGPPLTIDWEPICTESFSIEAYETARDKARGPPRDRTELILPGAVRSKLLRDHGVSKRKQSKALKEIKKIQKFRDVEAEKAIAELARARQNR